MASPNIPPDGPRLCLALSGRQLHFGFDNTFARLPERFYVRVDPTPVAAPRIVKVNVELTRELGLDADALTSEHGVAVLSGGRMAEGAEPLALAYAGHQFGYFVSQLGDGRANLLGELVSRDGKRYDVQLKGSGRTPFHAAGTAELHLDQCYESTLSARPWRRWAYPLHAHWLPSPQANGSNGTQSCPEQC